MRVEFDVDNRDRRLRSGTTARVFLELQRVKDAITVPIAAMRTQGEARSVFIVQDRKAKQRPVKTGLESPEWIQILDGLSGDEEVVVAAAANLTDAARVRVKR